VAASGWQEYRDLSFTTTGAILFLGIGCSGLGYWFWYAALERIDTSQVAAFLYLEPLVTLLSAVALLGESVTWSTIFGGMLVLVGVLTVQAAPPLKSAKTAKPKPA
jgi:drug/metabolite transporter (DMT)-like permease